MGVVTCDLVLRAASCIPARVCDDSQLPQRQAMLGLAKQVLAGPWPALARLVNLAMHLGMPVYLVGGQVRDLMLQHMCAGGRKARRPHGDIDLVVEGDAPVLAQQAVIQLGGAITSPANPFLTSRWQPSEGPGFDLATARSESYSVPAALPEVKHADLTQDLCRRDFTVNAMALRLGGSSAGQLYDPYGGVTDLKAGRLRVLHDLSFYDDPTRVFRAVRFAARFDMHLAADTSCLLRAALQADVIQRLSQARIGAELDLIFDEPHVVQAFGLLRQWGILAAIELELSDDDALLEHLTAACQARHRLEGLVENLPPQFEVVWLVLAQQLSLSQRQAWAGWIIRGKAALQRWLGGPKRLQAALIALGGTDDGRRHDALAGLDAVERVCLLAHAKDAAQQAVLIWWEQTGRHVRTSVTGHTLLHLGYSPGPSIKAALAAALHAAQAGATGAEQQAAAEAVLPPRRPSGA